MDEPARKNDLARVIDTITDGLLIVDREGRFEFANASAESILDAPRAQLVGHTFDDLPWSLSDPDGRRLTSGELPAARAIETGRAVRDVEVCLVREDGARVSVSMNAAPLFDGGGQPTGAAVSFADITGRRVAEAAATGNQRLMESVFSCIQDGISILDSHYQIIRVNPAMERWYAHAMPLEGKKCFTAYHGRTEPCDVCPTRETLRTGNAAHEVVRMRGPGGETVGWLDVFTFPMRETATGAMTGVIEYVRDITERARKKRVLVDSEARLSVIIDNMNAVVFVKDMNGRFVLANREFEALFHMKRADVAGKTNQDLFMPEMARAWDADEQAVIESGRPMKTEEVVSTESGTRTYVTVKFMLRDAEGETYGVCGISTDITDLKRAQAELQERDQAIRQAYVDVFGAVTGNRLVIMTPQEIEAALGTPILPTRTIKSYKELSHARAEIRKAVEKRALAIASFDEYIIGVCEALTNAVKHGGAATYQVCDRAGTLQVAISDTGPGIDFKVLPSAMLEVGFSTMGSLGVGFTVILEVSERVLLSTEPGNTMVVLETSR